jgi:hypothetical protein
MACYFLHLLASSSSLTLHSLSDGSHKSHILHEMALERRTCWREVELGLGLALAPVLELELELGQVLEQDHHPRE